MKDIAVAKTFFRIVAFIIIFIFVRSPHDGWIVLVAYSITSACIFLYLLIKMINMMGTFGLEKFSETKNILDKSKFSFIITIVPVIYNNASMIFLSIFINPIQLGYYYGISRIYRGFNSLYGPIGQAFYPRLSSFNNKYPEKTRILIIKLFWIMFFIGIGFSGIIIVFSTKIITLLLGKSFLPATNALKLFGLVLPLTAISHVLGRQWLMILGKDSDYAIVQIFSSIVGFIAIPIMISEYGILSIPLSLIIFESISIIMILIFSSRKK